MAHSCSRGFCSSQVSDPAGFLACTLLFIHALCADGYFGQIIEPSFTFTVYRWPEPGEAKGRLRYGETRVMFSRKRGGEIKVSSRYRCHREEGRLRKTNDFLSFRRLTIFSRFSREYWRNTGRYDTTASRENYHFQTVIENRETLRNLCITWGVVSFRYTDSLLFCWR